MTLTRQQLEERLSALHKASLELVKDLSSDTLLERIILLAKDQVDAKYAALGVLDENEQLVNFIPIGMTAEEISKISHKPIGLGMIGALKNERKPIRIESIRNDSRSVGFPDNHPDMVAFLGVPIISGDKLLGQIYLTNKIDGTPFTEADQHVIETMAVYAAVAIANARLHKQAKRVAILEERERFGMDMHDGVIQSIYGVGLALTYGREVAYADTEMAIKKIDEGITGLNSTIRDIRAYILDLNPRQLQLNESLEDGIKRLIDEAETHTNTDILLYSSVNGNKPLEHTRSLTLFHICQEALANVAKHAKARHATVRLWDTDDKVLVEISDNGQGFDLERMSITLGHGISNMHKRARKIGGNVEVSSNSNHGTTVKAWVPSF